MKAELIEFFSMQTLVLIRRGRVGVRAVWHQSFVFEQDILISVELVSTQEAAIPSWHGLRVVNCDVYSRHNTNIHTNTFTGVYIVSLIL